MVVMEEKRRRLILLLGLYMFFYMLVKHVVDIQTMILQGEWEKFALLSLVLVRMGHIKSIWSQGWMYKFIDCLLLGLWTEKSLGIKLE